MRSGHRSRRSAAVRMAVLAAAVAAGAPSAHGGGLVGSLVQTPFAPLFAAPPGGIADGVPPIPLPDMGGRWVFDAFWGGSCSISLSGRPGDRRGSVAPESGCPPALFASRKWAFESGILVIRDRSGRLVAQFLPVLRARFEGRDAGGRAVTLTR